MRTPLLPVVAAIALAACNNGFGANFQGEITMKTTRPNAPESSLTIKAKGDRLRIEMPAPGGGTASAIPTSRKRTR